MTNTLHHYFGDSTWGRFELELLATHIAEFAGTAGRLIDGREPPSTDDASGQVYV
jgi:hypothetical protein